MYSVICILTLYFAVDFFYRSKYCFRHTSDRIDIGRYLREVILIPSVLIGGHHVGETK